VTATDRNAAITGMGAVTPLGVGVAAYAQGLRGGKSGVRPLGFSDERIKSSVAAQCVDFDPLTVLGEAEVARVPRLVPMAIAAAREAAAQSGLAIGPDLGVEASRRIGLILGTGGGGIDFTLSQAEAGHQGRRPSLWTITNGTHGNLAGELSIALGLRGPSLCISTGCASSSDAVGMALDQLRSDRPGTPDAWVVVGADAHVRWETLWGMELLRVISTRDWRGEPEHAGRASRPFDKTRDGFVLGEGAWAVVLERPEAARRREARPIARVMGYGATCDAFHRVRPDPEMAESVRAMHLAIEDAGLTRTDVEVIHYHGTSTQLNDAVETQAVKSAFGDHASRLVGHSVKGAIGHPQGASGLAAMVATLAGLTGADGGGPFLVPTINLEEPDPVCDLDYTARASRATGAKTALVNCLAFGAKNSALVVRAE
jgi:3-oxoacyl-[acyl-carrier-protein] synthase II